MERRQEAIKSFAIALRNIIFGASGGAAWYVIAADASLTFEIATFLLLAILAGAVDFTIRVMWFSEKNAIAE